jgi:hypothetical protein
MTTRVPAPEWSDIDGSSRKCLECGCVIGWDGCPYDIDYCAGCHGTGVTDSDGKIHAYSCCG